MDHTHQLLLSLLYTVGVCMCVCHNISKGTQSNDRKGQKLSFLGSNSVRRAKNQKLQYAVFNCYHTVDMNVKKPFHVSVCTACRSIWHLKFYDLGSCPIRAAFFISLYSSSINVITYSVRLTVCHRYITYKNATPTNTIVDMRNFLPLYEIHLLTMDRLNES